MRKRKCPLPGILAFLFIAAAPLSAAERNNNMMTPRVPADQLEAARALTNPLSSSPEAIEKGKGTCVNCHGASGRGDGMAAMGLDPSPRNFHHHGFWRHRTEGEIFWAIKHGVAGTAMIPFGGQLSDEETWAVMQYERSFAGDHGPPGMGPRGGTGHRGPRGDCCPGQ